jgi:hypothetical protein
VHARLEVAIAGEDARDHEVVLADRVLDARVERTRVADAGRAAVADQVEAEAIEVACRPVLAR